MVDRLAKYAHFLSLHHPFTAKSMAELFVKEVVQLHGVPHSIVSDRVAIFISQFWQEIFHLMSTLCIISAYHPQTDSQTKVLNRSLEQYLRCFTSEQPKF